MTITFGSEISLSKDANSKKPKEFSRERVKSKIHGLFQGNYVAEKEGMSRVVLLKKIYTSMHWNTD